MNNQTVTIRDFTYWQIVFSLGLASFFIFATVYSLQPILPLFTSTFQISISYASLSVSLSLVGLIIGLIAAGFLSDRRGRLLFIHLSVLLTAIILFILPLSSSFSLIVGLRFIQGIVVSGVLGAALAYMSEEIHPKYFGFAATLYVSCNSVGGMVGRFLTGYIAEKYSWEMALTILGVFGLITFFIVLIALPKSKHFIRSDKTVRDDLKGFLVHLKNPVLLVLFGLGAILQMSFTGMWTFLPFHLLEHPYNYSLQLIAYFYLAYSFGVVGAPIAGALTAKFSMKSIRIVGIFIMSAGLLLTLGTPILIVSIGLSLTCLGFFVTHSITMTTVSQTATHHRGSASSLYLIGYYAGVSAGTTLLTPLWESFNWIGIILFTAIVPIIYLAIVISVQKKINTKTA